MKPQEGTQALWTRMPRLDEINLAMLDELQRNGRATICDMAKAVHRSETTVRDRLLSLQSSGAIRAYRAELDWPRVGLPVHAYAQAEFDPAEAPGLAHELEAVPHVVSASFTTGSKPLMLEVRAHDLDHLAELLEGRIGALGLDCLEIHTVLRDLVAKRPLPLRRTPRDGRPHATPQTVLGATHDGNGRSLVQVHA